MFPSKWQQKCIMDDTFSDSFSFCIGSFACILYDTSHHKNTNTLDHMLVVFKLNGINEPSFVFPTIIQQWVTFAIDLATTVIESGWWRVGTLVRVLCIAIHPSKKTTPPPQHTVAFLLSQVIHIKGAVTQAGDTATNSHRSPLVKEHSHTVTTGVCHTPICFHYLVHFTSAAMWKDSNNGKKWFLLSMTCRKSRGQSVFALVIPNLQPPCRKFNVVWRVLKHQANQRGQIDCNDSNVRVVQDMGIYFMYVELSNLSGQETKQNVSKLKL